MADISKITLPSGNAYDIKDVTARGAVSNITRSGTTFTATKLNGDTFTFTQQDNNTIPSAYCTTAAGTAAKAASFTNYNLLAKSYFMLVISTTNTVQGAITLNVNSKGAKPIYINGAASSASNYTMPAGTYLVYYDGTNYYIRTDGKITGDITGNAATVNGLTVQTAVPASAKFTDTNNAVTQTATTTNANYEVLFSVTADNTTRTEGARKNNNLLFNPSTGNLQVTQINGVTVGSSPKFTDANTTYSSMSTSEADTGTATTARSLTAANLKTIIVNRVYPVGSIYMSVNSTNPGTLFGGTWEQLKDRFLLGVGDTYKTVSATGGSATHTLTANEMPSHSHTSKGYISNSLASQTSGTHKILIGNGTETTYSVNNTGGGAAHNNMPPYLTVYMWKRTK